MFLNLFLFYQVVWPLGRKSVNKYLYLYWYLYLCTCTATDTEPHLQSPDTSPGSEYTKIVFAAGARQQTHFRCIYSPGYVSGGGKCHSPPLGELPNP